MNSQYIKRGFVVAVLTGLVAAMWFVNKSNQSANAAESSKTDVIYKGGNIAQPATTHLSLMMNTTHTFDDTKQAALAAISERLKELDSLRSNVVATSLLDSGEKQKIIAEITIETNGLNELLKSISNTNADSDLFEKEISGLTKNYPVFSVLLPQVQGLEMIMTDQQILSSGLTSEQKLDSIVADAKKNKRDTSTLEKDIQTYHADMQEVTTLLAQARQNFLAITFSDLEKDQTYRDAGIDYLAKASSGISQTSDYLNKTVAPLANSLTN